MLVLAILMIIFFFIFFIFPLIFLVIGIKYLKKFGFKISFSGVGLISPFYFIAKNFYIQFNYKNDFDYFELSCKKISLFIDPISIFKKKLIIQKILMELPYLYYENKYNSYRKIDLLPKFNQIIVKNFKITNGKIFTIDYMLPGPYQLYLNQINCFIHQFDLAVPISLLFFIQKGVARLDQGTLEIQTNYDSLKPTGSIILKDIKWTSIVGISVPFIGTSFDLFVYFTHQNQEEVLVRGYLHPLGVGENSKEEGMPFQFLIRWNEYRLPIDLGLQKLIEKIFENINPSLLEKGIVYLGKEVFDRIKKVPEK